jgi:predicted transposase/invertase (TIGR01784 family)
MEANGEELKEDKRIFALPVLAAKRMLEAGGQAEKRGKYSLELLELIEARNLSSEKTWSLKRFVYRILQIGKEDIDPKVREAWKMQFRPISEVVKDMHIRDAREEGMEAGMEKGREEGKFEVARLMLARKMSVSDIIDITGLNEKDILSL